MGVVRPNGAGERAVLVGLLAFTSGCVDVVTLMAIGGAFTSVVTGNLTFIGRAAGTASLTPAVHAVLAVLGYIVGVAVGARIAHVVGRTTSYGGSADWPFRATVVFGVECALLIAINIAWISAGAEPSGRLVDVLLVVAALALGIQGASARTIAGAPSTTYMTGALTTLTEALAIGRRAHVDPAAAVGLVTLVAGGAVSAVLVDHARKAALLPPLAAVLIVVMVKLRHHRDDERSSTVTA